MLEVCAAVMMIGSYFAKIPSELLRSAAFLCLIAKPHIFGFQAAQRKQFEDVSVGCGKLHFQFSTPVPKDALSRVTPRYAVLIYCPDFLSGERLLSQ